MPALLFPLSTRIDPLIKELVSGSLGRNNTTIVEGLAATTAIQIATLEALAAVLDQGGSRGGGQGCVVSDLKQVTHN
jgi:hypothetical protein